jgi:hypothetical protein
METSRRATAIAAFGRSLIQFAPDPEGNKWASMAKRRQWIITAVGVLLPLIAYFGTYYGLARAVPDPLAPLMYKELELRYPGESVGVWLILLPAHQLDRRLRPTYWGTKNPDIPRLDWDLSSYEGVKGYLSFCKFWFIDGGRAAHRAP